MSNTYKFILFILFSYCHLTPIHSQIFGTVTNCSTPTTNNGTISLTIKTGIPPYTFIWDNMATTSELTDLAPGKYCVTVTDAYCCSASVCYSVEACDNKNIEIKQLSKDDGTGSGALEVISEGPTPFTYAWSATHGFNSTDNPLKHLYAGTYEVIVTNGEGCKTLLTGVVRSECEIDINADIKNESVAGATDGSILVDAQGGSPPYTFKWDHGGTHQFEHHLSEGNYCVTVTDEKGCTADACFDVKGCNNNTAKIIKIADDDGTGTGSLKVEAEGQAPYTYNWSGPNGYTATTQTVDNLHTGYYIVTVTNALGCSNILNGSICTGFTVIPPFIGEPCVGEANGFISFAEMEQSGDYNFEWYDHNFNIVGKESKLAFLKADLYQIKITRKNATQETCEYFKSIDLKEFGLNGYNDVTIKPTCFNEQTGSITLNNVPNTILQVIWENGTTGTALNNLAGGLYCPTFTNLLGCKAQQCYDVTSYKAFPDKIQFYSIKNPSCKEIKNGEVVIFPYNYNFPDNTTYLWSDGQEGKIVKNLGEGIYSITCNAPDYCPKIYTVELNAINDPSNFGSEITHTCNDAKNGAIQLLLSTSESEYSIIWEQGFAGTSLSSLAPGDYTVTVAKNKGACQFKAIKKTYTVQKTIPDNSLVADIYPACEGKRNGAIYLKTVGLSPNLTYTWNAITNNATTSYINYLEASTTEIYTVTVSDDRGCSITKSWAVPEEKAEVISEDACSKTMSCQGTYTILKHKMTGLVVVKSATNTSNGALVCENNGSFTIATGESATFKINFTNFSTGQNSLFAQGTLSSGSKTFNNLAVGTYNILMTSVEGKCTLQQSAQIDCCTDNSTTNTVVINPIVTPATGVGKLDGMISLNLVNPQNYIISWIPQPANQSPDKTTLFGLGKGEYCVQISPKYAHCNLNSYSFECFTIADDCDFKLTSKITGLKDCDEGGSGSIALTATSTLSSPFSFNWNNNKNTSTINALPGTYSVTVTETKTGCRKVVTELTVAPSISDWVLDEKADCEECKFTFKCGKKKKSVDVGIAFTEADAFGENCDEILHCKNGRTCKRKGGDGDWKVDADRCIKYRRCKDGSVIASSIIIGDANASEDDACGNTTGCKVDGKFQSAIYIPFVEKTCCYEKVDDKYMIYEFDCATQTKVKNPIYEPFLSFHKNGCEKECPITPAIDGKQISQYILLTEMLDLHKLVTDKEFNTIPEVIQPLTVTVYPNPFQHVLQIKVTNPKATTWTLRLFNTLGQVVFQQNKTITKGESNFSIDLQSNNLESSLYLLQIIDTEGNSVKTQKVTHQN